MTVHLLNYAFIRCNLLIYLYLSIIDFVMVPLNVFYLKKSFIDKY